MEHREAHDAGEAAVGEGHRGRVRLDDLDLAGQGAPQAPAVALGQLDNGQRALPSGEHTGRRTESGADLEGVVAEIHAGEAPGEQLALDGAGPPAG